MCCTPASSVTARRRDLGHHRFGGGGVAALAVDGAAEVVDHHLGAATGQLQRVLLAEPAARARDDRHLAVEANVGVGHDHVSLRVRAA